MKIQFERVGFGEQATEMFHIGKLFFEDVEAVYEPADDARLHIKVTVTADEAMRTITAEVLLTDRDTGAVHKSRHERAIGARDEGHKRAVKRSVGYGLLQVLREYTGIEQAWGTLTGVRPTKLMHNLMMKHGMEHCKQVLRDEYLVTEPKVELLSGIAERQLKVIPDLFRLDREVSIYIGIPFCPTKCAYCTFPAYDIRGNNGSVEAFLEGLHYEIREMGRWMREADVTITTIYWGGGTPTSITADQMDALFNTMQEAFPAMEGVRELTVEAGRPDTITEDKINVMKKWKVDRISINPQSFTQATLDTIGRHHTVTETLDKFKLSREMGMNNINMDLIIGLPNEGMTELQRTLDQTAELLPESLTVHTLSFKRASRMTKNKDDYEVAERDEITDMIRTTAEWTERHGYVPYYMYRQKNILGNQENVGYSLVGYESLYNILMMEERQTIIGLGCGAVSKVLFPKVEHEDGYEQRIERFPNPKEPAVYNKAYKEYIVKKISLLDEAYGRVTTGQS
ncbi:coproporphyrinogen III oxidase [Paenibacillus allorhizosphaerae]|uniref:Oxygen-independent coproporphyrinogen-III oxidase-like protein HemZ n=1 Tax=Paenibacillus allorhizosphaerae TaxID=2849866 RepID=A0ABM8VRE5_9BACL|nr:coproporphyrinogen III oxidase [Paenibacillus allorhizosphaerae]CAG7655184.1 Oxygen-independent coproporphyrinogen-III oxidase-like protein HemZ [Paenibacillus allorhizosphaerae]